MEATSDVYSVILCISALWPGSVGFIFHVDVRNNLAAKHIKDIAGSTGESQPKDIFMIFWGSAL